MNLFEKMLKITSEIGTVNKNLEVGYGSTKYKAVGEADVLKAVKELEAKYGIYSYPCSRRIIESQVLQVKNSKGEEKTNLFMRVETEYKFVNTEKPEETITVTTYGDGVDAQDKAPGKAMTYADKYALLKAYKIVTGDDPDQEPSGEIKISESDAKILHDLMIRKGINPETSLLQNYGVSDTKDLTQIQRINILKAIQDMPDKE